MTEGELLARIRQAESRLEQLEYRIAVLEAAAAQNQQLLASLRSAGVSG
jgi:hypothetical protein